MSHEQINKSYQIIFNFSSTYCFSPCAPTCWFHFSCRFHPCDTRRSRGRSMLVSNLSLRIWSSPDWGLTKAIHKSQKLAPCHGMFKVCFAETYASVMLLWSPWESCFDLDQPLYRWVVEVSLWKWCVTRARRRDFARKCCLSCQDEILTQGQPRSKKNRTDPPKQYTRCVV